MKYVESVKNGRYLLLHNGHYVHDTDPDLIAEESIKFIGEL